MDYITAEEIARRFRVDVSTVYRWGRDNKIPSKVIEGTIRFPASLLDLDPVVETASAGPVTASQE